MPFGFHFHVYRIGIKGPDHWEELHQMAIRLSWLGIDPSSTYAVGTGHGMEPQV